MPRNLKHHVQKLENPTIIVAASTDKSASHINVLMLYSVFHLHVNENNDCNAKFCPPYKEVIQRLWNKYWYLKINVHDEVSMTQEHTFNECLNFTLQLIKGKSLPVGGVSITVSEGFLHLLPVMGTAAF